MASSKHLSINFSNILSSKHRYSLYHSISSIDNQTSISFAVSNKYSLSFLKSSLSCPNGLSDTSCSSLDISKYFNDDAFSSSQFRNNSDSDTCLRKELLPHLNNEINTLSGSFDNISNSTEIFQTSNVTTNFVEFRKSYQHFPELEHTYNDQFLTNTKQNSFNKFSPLAVSDSSLSTSNSDFVDSSTEQSETFKSNSNKKPKEGWAKIRRIMMWSPFIQTYKKKYPWIQIAGHHGNFKQGVRTGTILKKSTLSEKSALEKINCEGTLVNFIPQYSGIRLINNEEFIELEDLLRDFTKPTLMDIKIGTRTFLEDDYFISKNRNKWRKDLYLKMVSMDSSVPNDEENSLSSISKFRYMSYRESLTSTTNLGFRIEGIKTNEGPVSRNYKYLKYENDILEVLLQYCNFNSLLINSYIFRLRKIVEALSYSQFFRKHQFIGTSLLFVHDSEPVTYPRSSIWIIDFGKTLAIPPGIKIDHSSNWVPGNYEDGYLFGINNLSRLFESSPSYL